MITVHTKPRCIHCEATKAYLSKHDIPFEEKPIDDKIIAWAKERGIYVAPIVTDDAHPELAHGGFSPETLDKMSEEG